MPAPTLEDVQQFIKTHELKPGTTHILTYDWNSLESHTMHAMGKALWDNHSIALYMLAYDATTNESPIQLFEVKRDADQP